MPRGFGAATAAEAVEGLKASNETSDVSNLLRGFARPETWGSIAYLSMCERTGSAINIFASDAVLESNGSIEIRGDYGPPPGHSVAAQFEAPSAGTYACTVRLSRRPAFIGSYGFAIDQTVLGSFGINAGPPANYTFVVRLGQGNHTFRVTAQTVSFWFYSLTVLEIPELDPG